MLTSTASWRVPGQANGSTTWASLASASAPASARVHVSAPCVYVRVRVRVCVCASPSSKQQQHPISLVGASLLVHCLHHMDSHDRFAGPLLPCSRSVYSCLPKGALDARVCRRHHGSSPGLTSTPPPLPPSPSPLGPFWPCPVIRRRQPPSAVATCRPRLPAAALAATGRQLTLGACMSSLIPAPGARRGSEV